MPEYKLPELLCPAGDWERMETAVRFGADAVYLGGGEFGMRASQAYFAGERLAAAAEYCHKHEVRLYLTMNTLPRSDELKRLPEALRQAEAAGVDALIVSDLGVLSMAKQYTPDMEIHISTQAGVVNYAAATALYELGAKRVVLARELSLPEIAEIRSKTPPELELEAFVHGAMCMSVSGRCLISNYLTGRDANRGECAQPCRWKYRLVEEKRPNEYFPVVESDEGSYILNARDMCLLPYLDQIADAGVTSFKIEGRAKSSYYTAVTTNAYRIAMDDLKDARQMGRPWELPDWLNEEITKVSHRRYSTGFYFTEEESDGRRKGVPGQYLESGGYIREWDVTALVTDWKDGRLFLSQKNKFCEGDELEILQPGKQPEQLAVRDMKNELGEPITAASHPEMKLSLECDTPYAQGSILRRKAADGVNEKQDRA